jgi:hypothetical protein
MKRASFEARFIYALGTGIETTWIQTPSALKFKPQLQSYNCSLIVLVFHA